ncbi:MAG: ATP-binding protein, partial [Acidobacteriota bacterium]
NSAQALSLQPGKITVKTEMRDRNMVLTVLDDGPGISPGDIDKVMEPFFTTKQDGTGLGLSICRSLVWQHGGAIELESTPGHGTKVEIRLSPAEVAEAAETLA